MSRLSPVETHKLDFFKRELGERSNQLSGGVQAVYIVRKGDPTTLPTILRNAKERRMKAQVAMKVRLQKNEDEMAKRREEAIRIIEADVDPPITPINIKKEIRSLLSKYQLGLLISTVF